MWHDALKSRAITILFVLIYLTSVGDYLLLSINISQTVRAVKESNICLIYFGIELL